MSIATEASHPETSGRTRSNTVLSIKPIGALGAEVRGLPGWGVPASELVRDVLVALRRHLVLVFRGVKSPTLPERDAFFRAFPGRMTMDTIEGKFHFAPYKDVREHSVHKRGDETFLSNDVPGGDPELHFHNDLLTRTTFPVLRALEGMEIPPGAVPTRFRDMYTAYEMLPLDVRARLASKVAVYLEPAYYRAQRGAPEFPRLCDAMHPVLKTHPHSGRVALLINTYTTRIAGLDDDESERIKAMLLRHADETAPVYEHHWEKGDFVVWDNLGVQHARDSSDASKHGLRVLRSFPGMME
jgi:alpha-ketoglutarate-dependent taurine dioxygenase